MSAGDPDKFDDKPGSIAELRALLLKFPSIGKFLRVPRTFLHSFDIPYLAGISEDGRTVYIDQHVPTKINGIEVAKYLDVHESVEYALWRAAGVEGKLAKFKAYEPCHHLATAAENYAVLSDGHSWEEYQGFLRPDYAPLEHEDIKRVPPDLALYPYKGKLLAHLRKVLVKKESKFTQEEVNYREAGEGARMRCGNCWKFLPKVRGCIFVAGMIEKDDTCDKWEAGK